LFALLLSAAISAPTGALGAGLLCPRDGGKSGSVVVLDDDGRPMVPEETPAVDNEGGGAAVARGDGPLELVDAPGGGEMVVLDGRFHHFVEGIVRRDGPAAARCEQHGPDVE
jgi:hypothetical protein